MTDWMKRKVLVVFPDLVTRGGAERTIALLSQGVDIDILTNRYIPEKTFEEFEKIKIIELREKNKIFFMFKILFKKIPGYDVFNGHAYFLTNLMSIRNRPYVWFCNTPKRDLYPPFKEYYFLREKKPIKRFLRYMNTGLLKLIDKIIVKNFVDVIVANSENIKKRVKIIYGRDSIKINNPVDTGRFYFSHPEGYYLCVTRLDPMKRVETLIETFNKIPEKNLKIVCSTREEEYLEKLRKSCKKNIEILTGKNESEVLEYYSKCICTIYIPILEDFGLVPVESMAAGKPCIGSNEGGLKETIVDGKTGLLIDVNVENLIKAVNFMTKEKALSMKNDCMNRAKLFDTKIFCDKMSRVFRQTKHITFDY